MMDKNPANMTLVTCKCCGNEFEVYKSKVSPNKYCPTCLKADHSQECLGCGKVFHWNHKIRLSAFFLQDYCSDNCKSHNNQDCRSSLISSIFNNLIAERNDSLRTKVLSSDLDEVIKENSAYFRLFTLYVELEKYNDGVKLEDRLPHTQLYLLDILRRIRNLNELLRIDPKRKSVGWGSSTKDAWEVGPSDSDIKQLEKELRKECKE